MRIEHAAIWVKDLEKMKEFYQTYFHGTPNEKYVNAKKQFESYFLRFETGSRLELMRKPGFTDKEEEREYYGFAHLAFSAGSKERVLELTERLRRDGFRIHSEPRTTGDGYFESGILDPEGNLVEITI